MNSDLTSVKKCSRTSSSRTSRSKISTFMLTKTTTTICQTIGSSPRMRASHSTFVSGMIWWPSGSTIFCHKKKFKSRRRRERNKSIGRTSLIRASSQLVQVLLLKRTWKMNRSPSPWPLQSRSTLSKTYLRLFRLHLACTSLTISHLTSPWLMTPRAISRTWLVISSALIWIAWRRLTYCQT